MFTDSIFVAPASVRYLPIRFDRNLIYTTRITFDYKDYQYSFAVKSLFYGEALSVNSRVADAREQ